MGIRIALARRLPAEHFMSRDDFDSTSEAVSRNRGELSLNQRLIECGQPPSLKDGWM